MYPLPPAVTVTDWIIPPTVCTDAFAPVPSPRISTENVPLLYPEPGFSMYTCLIWLKLISESAASLTFWIWELVEVDQSLGTTIYSVESNFIISLGDIENKNFQTYPSPLVPAADGSKSVMLVHLLIYLQLPS